jgi:predicted DNA binding protein
MPVTESNDTKQQIIQKLDAVPAEKLRSVLEYVRFVSLDEDSQESLLEPDHLTDRERELIKEALDDPRPDVSDKDFQRELGL